MATFDRKDKEGRRVLYKVVGEASPETPPVAEGDVGGDKKVEVDQPIAVIVAHGMGQQVPFETLGQFVEGLQKQAGVSGTKVLAKTEFVELPGGGRERLSRLEAVLCLQGRERVVHFYEIYWAPLTEGVATLRDVIGFLLKAGIRRLKATSFRRWLFGDFRDFGIPIYTPAVLLVAVAVVASLVALNTAIVAVAAAKASGIGGSASWQSSETVAHLTRTFGVLLVLMTAFVVTLGLSWFRRIPETIRWVFRALSVLTFAAALVGLIGAAIITAAAMIGWPLIGERLVSAAARVDGFAFVIWPILAAVSWIIRAFLLQSVGDVAVYVESQSVDRFSKARQAIREAAMKTARAVYDTPRYRHIAFAGHSLGSVVAYDTLNQLLLEGPERRARTRLLMTFASPLDKTAFLFGAQVKDNPARELLASSLQPLIHDPAMRPRWVNVYSPWDVIGGSVSFYDCPPDVGCPARRVENSRDPEATTLLVAHQEHWKSRFIYKTFIDALEAEL